jgi:di/tricarboxylate transporter
VPAPYDFWYVLAVLAGMTVLLVREYLSPALVVFGALVLCVAGGVIPLEQAIEGFASPAVLTIASLYVIATALQATNLMSVVANFLLGKRHHSTTWRLFGFLYPLSVLSAFTNNTTLVAALIPAVRKWSRFNGQPLSKYLLPLSYATIMGGAVTLVGTSTNLVVHGLLIRETGQGLDFFTLAPIGIPIALAGILYVCTVGHRLLPSHGEPFQQLTQNSREFVVELKVAEEYPYLGYTVEEAGLRHLRGLFLFQIERDGHTIAPVEPDTRLRLGDRLFFTGLPETIIELQKQRGLNAVKDQHFDIRQYDSDKHAIFETVLSASSPLVGKTVRDSNFRSHYDAVILAIHRNGERVNQKVGDIVLHSGDTLLLLGDRNFSRRWYNTRDFYLVTEYSQEPSKPREKVLLTALIFLAFIALAATRVLPIALAATGAALALIISRCVSQTDAKDSIDFTVLIIIASAFGLGEAVAEAGVAKSIGLGLTNFLGQYGTLPLLFGVYFLTNLYSAFITNTAAAALLFPVAGSIASAQGVPLLPLALLIAVAASCEFSLPIGYQTNLMVLGPGGYRARDYLRTGLPLNLLCGVISVLVVYVMYFGG